MTANQRKRPSRNNRAVQLTSEQLVEAKTLDLKAHHSFKNLMGLAAISVVVFVCLGSLIHKQRSVMNEWDLGEVIRGVDLKAGTLAKNNIFITNKGQFEASGVTVSLTGTKLKLQQHQDGKYYVCNSATGDCVLVSDVQAEKIRDQL